eukprot:TRINITY_DN30781_c0_g1_i1.p1 TRINITY_DN30781_c0_g1~~TRINITY_DN30781_c0_g1_i1.p1  ORF type:complete len:448 (-),score=45.76 TRINITY_DN30781_c0_g1_i1:173-1516(-)
MQEQRGCEEGALSADASQRLATASMPANEPGGCEERLLKVLLRDNLEDKGASSTAVQPRQYIRLHSHANSSGSPPAARTLPQPYIMTPDAVSLRSPGNSHQCRMPAHQNVTPTRVGMPAPGHSNLHSQLHIGALAASLPLTENSCRPCACAQPFINTAPASMSPTLVAMPTMANPHQPMIPVIVPRMMNSAQFPVLSQPFPVMPSGLLLQNEGNTQHNYWPAVNLPAAGMSQQFSSQAYPHSASQTASASLSSHPTGSEVMPAGTLHRFHKSAAKFGRLSDDFRTFVKEKRKGRSFTVITEDKGHSAGVVNYLVQFTVGERGALCSADGVGMLFNPVFPSTQNLHTLQCIFLASTGHICTRCQDSVSRSGARLPEVQQGDYIEIRVDFEKCLVGFKVWSEASRDRSDPGYTEVSFQGFQPKEKTKRHIVACLAAVIKHADVGLTLGS